MSYFYCDYIIINEYHYLYIFFLKKENNILSLKLLIIFIFTLVWS